MFVAVSACSGDPAAAGLRGNDDPNAVLVCRAHYGRLRRLDPQTLDKLERFLVPAFRGVRA